MSVSRRPRIHVLAGVNGAGKSSIGGAAVCQHGGEYFNPDEVARTLRGKAPALTQADANSAAWHLGASLLSRAIDERFEFTLETTLGGTPSQAFWFKPLNKASRYTSGMWGWAAQNCTSSVCRPGSVEVGTTSLRTTFIGATNIAVSTSSRYFPTSPPCMCTTTAQMQIPQPDEHQSQRRCCTWSVGKFLARQTWHPHRTGPNRSWLRRSS